MSAFLLAKEHIDVLIELATRRIGGHEAALAFDQDDAMGRALWQENLRSVQHRYPNDPDGNSGHGSLVDGYTFTRPRRPATVVEGLKALDSYEYQACEHPGWALSGAHRFCQRLRRHLTSHLPGYEAAPWCWDAATVPPPVPAPAGETAAQAVERASATFVASRDALAASLGDFSAYQAMRAIENALYPDGDRDHEWTADTLDEIAALANAWANVEPDPRGVDRANTIGG